MNKVLIVDDDVAVREALYNHLSKDGRTVLTADSGQHAIELLIKQRTQLIVLDDEMPELSGMQSVEAIREFEAHVPIVLMRKPEGPPLSPKEITRFAPIELVQKTSDMSSVGEKINQMLQEMDQKEKDSDKDSKSDKSGVRVRCLIVDDDAACRQMARLLLERCGIDVIEANSGEEALKALKEKPQAVLLDISMPGMDGLMTLRKIKAEAPNLPVIMVSSFGEQDTVAEAIRIGAYDYVQKPFSMEYLETVVRSKVIMGIQG